jgi:hypothetical protein
VVCGDSVSGRALIEGRGLVLSHITLITVIQLALQHPVFPKVYGWLMSNILAA